MQDVVKIADREIGEDRPVFVVAEAGINHNGRIDLAKRLIDEASLARADGIKFQSFIASRLVMEDDPSFHFFKGLELSFEEQRSLFDLSKEKGIIFLSTPFDRDSADMLEGLGIEAFKIASTDITNLPLISHIAGKGRPIILSTGASTLGEIERAVGVIEKEGNDNIILLHCNSTYPARMNGLNLRAISTMKRVFGCPVGFSDHTIGTLATFVAVALGAVFIEKHFTVNKSLDGPDHRLSLEPDEFRRMVDGIRDVEGSLGDGGKRPMEEEMDVRRNSRRGIVAVVDIPEGTPIMRDMVDTLRPQIGISPEFLDIIIGRRARHPISKGDAIRWEDV